MSLRKKSTSSGFTLIETLVYLALFSIIIGGTMVTVYQVIQGSGTLEAKAILQEEGNFILAKLNWALTGAAADTQIISPTVGNNDTSLQIYKPSLNLYYRADWDSGNLIFGTGSANPPVESILNSDRVTLPVFNFSFGQPALNQVKANFTLRTLSDQGQSYSQDFEIIKYLRK